MANITDAVAEFQGLYGPFTVAERVLQKIWLHRDFASYRLTLTDGRGLEIVSPGKWNLLDGPDFRDARLRIDGREISGDVEVHFHADDWRAHGHAENPNYAGVALHVVLFSPDQTERPPRRGDGTEIPTLVLLPLLHRDLEDYAADDALEGITARDEWRRFAELGREPVEEIRRILCEKATARWRQKVNFAKLRVTKLGWTEAAHQTALEILGYRRNRAAMLTIGARYPLAVWVDGIEPDAMFAEGRALWQLHGVRPANHPRARLRQYDAWVRACPDWPEQLIRMAGAVPVEGTSDAANVGEARQALALKKYRAELSRRIMGDAVGGTRLDTLVCDGFLPLMSAQGGRDLSAWWFNWFLGDVPFAVRQAMPRLGITGENGHPFCHGCGQGLLGWILERPEVASG